MAYPRSEPMTFEAFLDWERRQETRHEFVDGQILAMPADRRRIVRSR